MTASVSPTPWSIYWHGRDRDSEMEARETNCSSEKRPRSAPHEREFKLALSQKLGIPCTRKSQIWKLPACAFRKTDIT
jgi:hypothetical protein